MLLCWFGGFCDDEVEGNVIGEWLQMNGLDAIVMTRKDMLELLQCKVNVLGMSKLEFGLVHISNSTQFGIG